MSERHLEPAKGVIAKMGGADVVASITGKHVSRVYRWMHPKTKGGTGGFIPHEDAVKLLGEAPIRGVELAPSDFFALGEVAA